jgi:selenocysteine lyase/cysteine desulfurase
MYVGMRDRLRQLRADTPGVRHRIHFNNAGAGLMPRPVVEAVQAHTALEAEIGGYEAADARSDAIAEFYAATGELLGTAPENIAFAPSATDAYSRALSSIPFDPGDVILTTRDDYVSNQIAFLSLRRRFRIDVVHAQNLPGGGVDVEELATLARSKRPRLVAVTHIPTNSGLVQPVAEIGALCRELDLLYLVDACQSAGQLPLDASEIGCDFLSATGRKFLRGPRGSGFLFVSARALAAGLEPLFIDMRGADWTGPDAYAPAATAARFEDWEFSYAAVLGEAAAVRYALGIGLEPIWERSAALAAELRAKLAAIDGVRVLDRGPELCAIVTFVHPAREADELHGELEARRINSAVSSRTTARYDFEEKGVESAVRLSPHYYNTEEEVDEVVAAVAELTSGDRRAF